MPDLNLKELVADIKALVAQWHYNKNETYTQAEILALIRDAVANLKLVDVVQELPTTNIKNNQLYLVVNETNILNNKFDIFLYVNNDWEQIDKLEFDIANYYTKNEADALLATKSDISHRHDNSTTLADGFMSKNDKAKLDGIASEANKTIVDSGLSGSSTNPVQNKVVKNALDNKAGLDTATSSANGLLSKEDKAKLDGIASEANKTIVDSGLSDSSINPVQNKVVKSALDTKAGLSTATTSSNGLMSSSDKTKLDGIATGANKTTVDSALSTTSTNPVQNKEVKNALDNKVDKIQGKGLSTEDYTTNEKTKLNGIENEANKITVDSALSTTSTNPVQNNIINNALNNKVDKISGKSLSTNDYTNDEKSKLAGIATGANKTIVDSGLSDSSINPVQNKVIKSALDNKANLNVATTSSNGLMSSSDKTKLDGIDNQANKTIVDSGLSDSSINPVQNKVVKSALDDLKTELESEIVEVSTNGTLELQSYAKTSDLANVATSGSYNDLTNKPTIPSANGTASNIKMDGTQSAGSLSTFAKADHVHPTDTSRAASNHTHGNINNLGVIANQSSKNVVTDANGKITTENKPTIPSANSTASNIKMDGTQSAGSLSTFAKADHVHPTDTSRASTNVATTSANGLMSSSDKTKLDSIANSANNYSHPTYNNVEKTTSGLYKIKTNSLGHITEITEVSKSDITALGIPGSDTNTTYGAVTQSANGLMTKEDKQKVDKSMIIGYGTLSGTVSAFTVSITGVTLTHGTLISVYNAVGANTANATLKVNSWEAKPLYYNASAIPASRFPHKSTVLLMYNTSLVSTGCWQLIYSYDSNNTYTAATNAPLVDGTATTGVSGKYAREDHVHPIDTSRAASDHGHGNINNLGVIPNQASKNVVTDANGKITTENKPTIPSANGTASNIKMDGTQSAGSLSSYAKADHVHPTDTSRASSDHAHGNINNSGVIANQASKNVVTDANGKITTENKPTIPSANGTASNIKMDGAQSAGSLSTFAKADHIHPTDTSRAPINHSHGWIAKTAPQYNNSGHTFTFYVNETLQLAIMSGTVTTLSASVQDYHWADIPQEYRPIAQTLISTHAPNYGVMYIKTNGELYFKCLTAFSTPKTFTFTTIWYYGVGGGELTLTSDKNILSHYDNDSATLTATYSENGIGIEGKTVIFTDITNNEQIGTGTTDANGVATTVYNSKGTGDINIQAECMNLQETYSLEDCIYYSENETECTPSNNYITIADLSDMTLPSKFELSMDYKTNYESRFGLFNKTTFTGNPNYSVFIGSSNGSNWYYGYRTTSTTTTDVNSSPTNYHRYTISRNENTFTYKRDDSSNYTKSVTWFNTYSYIIGMMMWGTNQASSVKNIKLKPL